MAHLDTYLFFDGNCAEAMRFYERVFHGKIDMMMTYGESPVADDISPEVSHRIMHAHLTVDGRALMASDAVTDQPFEGMRGFAVSMNYDADAIDEARRVFQSLADGGTIQMPLQKTFWAEAFGTLVDRYGTPWMINVSATQDDAARDIPKTG